MITLGTFLHAINHCEKDKWRLLQLQTVLYFPKPGAGARQVQGLARSVLYVRTFHPGRFGQFLQTELINAETAGNKQSWETNDFHNTSDGVTGQTPNAKRWLDAFVT